MTKLRRDVERSKEESRDLAMKVEMGRLQAEEEARLLEQLEEVRKNKEAEVCLNYHKPCTWVTSFSIKALNPITTVSMRKYP